MMDVERLRVEGVEGRSALDDVGLLRCACDDRVTTGLGPGDAVRRGCIADPGRTPATAVPHLEDACVVDDRGLFDRCPLPGGARQDRVTRAPLPRRLLGSRADDDVAVRCHGIGQARGGRRRQK